MSIDNALLTLVLASLTGLGGWFMKRKKMARENESDELDNVGKAIRIWRELSEDMTQKYDTLFQKYCFLENEYKQALTNERNCLNKQREHEARIEQLEREMKKGGSTGGY